MHLVATSLDNSFPPSELYFDISLTDSFDVIKAAGKLKNKLTVGVYCISLCKFCE